MNPPLPIRFTRRASRQVDEAGQWWPEHRTKAPAALREELERVHRHRRSIQVGLLLVWLRATSRGRHAAKEPGAVHTIIGADAALDGILPRAAAAERER